jgi:hypothetical protein
MRVSSPQFQRVWRWPALLALLTLFGLFSALLGQSGIWLWMSWATLTVPLFVAACSAVHAMRVQDES